MVGGCKLDRELRYSMSQRVREVARKKGALRHFPSLVRRWRLCHVMELLAHTPSLPDDGEKLFRYFGIRARGLVELGAFAIKADATFGTVYNLEIVSLAKNPSQG